MNRLIAWRPFVQNDDLMLWVGLLSRDTGMPASQRLKIKDEVDALSFDLAVSLRLLRFDNEKDRANKKFWVGLVGGAEAVADTFGDEILDSPVIDKYADGNTQVW